MVAKPLSINSILASIYKNYLVMPALPQFPDVVIGNQPKLVYQIILRKVNAHLFYHWKSIPL